ncbi:hypothetical protein [Kitasatospora sp. NPDC002040]|uniref:hypothetical protein n=1 Tax=Kitasatospora sp. NPDC002040 TaxID=3154661 RepID=UPI0033220585
MELGRAVRGARAAMFAAVCVLLASLGHVLMSGTGVAWWAPVAGFAAVGGLAWWPADRERGPLLVTGLTVGAQAGLHTLFSQAQAAAAPVLADRPAHHMADMTGMQMGGHSHHAGPAMEVHPQLLGGGAVGMLTAHLLAALLMGLWLSAGERAVFRLGRTLAARLLVPLLALLPALLRLLRLVVRPPHRPRPRPALFRTVRRLRQQLLVHALTSRGPPAGTAVR